MEWWNILVAILFVIGVTAYPGWNLVLRLELNFGNRTKILPKPSKPIKIQKKSSKPIKIQKKSSKPIKIQKKSSKQIRELEKIFGL